MDYIKTFELHKYDDITVKTFNQDELRKELFEDSTLKNVHKTYFSRIRYANNSDFKWVMKDLNSRFVVLFRGEEIIGVCKIGNYSKEEPKRMDISYCSIDRNYRGKGYLKLIIKELMELCIREDFTLGSSSWTVPGNLKLRPTIIKYAKQYNVDFKDNNEMHDHDRMYNKDLIARQEMTDTELEEYNKGNVYGGKPIRSNLVGR